MRVRAFLAGFFLSCAAAGCGGGTNAPLPTTTSSPAATGSPSPSPTPNTTLTGTPGPVEISNAQLLFYAVGATYAQSVTAGQGGYGGAFTASTTNCSGIATIANTNAWSFSVTPVAAGQCAFTITGGNGATATLSIGVTTLSVGGS